MRTLGRTAFLALLLAAIPPPAWAQERLDVRQILDELATEWRMIRLGLDGLRRKPPAPPIRPGTHGGGRLEVVEGIPILHLTGSPRDMGVQHGVLLGTQIEYLLDQYLGRFVASDAERRRMVSLCREMEPRIPRDIREEMQGLAEGADLAWDDVLLSTCFLDLYELPQCSVLHAGPDRSAEGTSFFGRNLDFPGLGVLDGLSVVIVREPRGKRAFASIAWPGLVGAITAMNSSGLALAVLVVAGNDNETAGMPYPILFRRLIERAKSVEEALGILDRSPITTANNLFLADASGRAVVAELSPGGIRHRSPSNGSLACTNHHIARPTRRFSLTYLSSRLRYERLSRAMQASRLDAGAVRRALGDTAPPWSNLQSMLIFPERLEIHLAAGKVPAARLPYVVLRKDTLFGRRTRGAF